MDSNAVDKTEIVATSKEVVEPVKEKKKPGPKPKVQSNEPEVKPAEAVVEPKVADEIESNETPETVESTETSKSADIISNEPEVNLTKKSLNYTYKNPAILYNGPSTKHPVCYVSHIRLLDEIKDNFIKCIGVIPGVGIVEGYVPMISNIAKLLSESNWSD